MSVKNISLAKKGEADVPSSDCIRALRADGRRWAKLIVDADQQRSAPPASAAPLESGLAAPTTISSAVGLLPTS
jgi:hypothetical protein